MASETFFAPATMVAGPKILFSLPLGLNHTFNYYYCQLLYHLYRNAPNALKETYIDGFGWDFMIGIKDADIYYMLIFKDGWSNKRNKSGRLDKNSIMPLSGFLIKVSKEINRIEFFIDKGNLPIYVPSYFHSYNCIPRTHWENQAAGE